MTDYQRVGVRDDPDYRGESWGARSRASIGTQGDVVWDSGGILLGSGTTSTAEYTFAGTPFVRLRTGFDKLRANGRGREKGGKSVKPFVLSLSKYERRWWMWVHSLPSWGSFHCSHHSGGIRSGTTVSSDIAFSKRD